jgi:hypothetical protein
LDAEGSINDAELDEPRDEFVYREMAAADRKYAQNILIPALVIGWNMYLFFRTKVVIRRLEAEIQKWQMVVDNVKIHK